VVRTDESIGVTQLLGSRAWAVPKACAYGYQMIILWNI